MVATSNHGEVNIFEMWVDVDGTIASKTLIATFINRNLALEFLKTRNASGCYNQWHYLDMREVIYE